MHNGRFLAPGDLRHREKDLVAACAELAVGIEHCHGLVGGDVQHTDLTRQRRGGVCDHALGRLVEGAHRGAQQVANSVHDLELVGQPLRCSYLADRRTGDAGQLT